MEVQTQFDGQLKNGATSLIIGAPGPKTLKRVVTIFEKSAIHRVQHTSRDDPTGNGVIFQYGPEAGYGPYLQELAGFLTEEYEDKVEPKDLFLTTGATGGLWLAATTFLTPGRGIVFMECPSYFLASSVLQNDLGHTIVGVPIAPDGVDVVELEKAMAREYARRSEAKSGKYWAIFYTVPTFHNPTGVVMSAEKSKKVVELARKYDILVFCDDVYNMLHYGEGSKSPKRLFAYDSKTDPDYQGHVISNGTFSKILGPGYRVGWIEAPQRLKEQLLKSGILASGGSMNNVMAGVVASAITLGHQKAHLQYLRQEYWTRIETIFEVFAQHLPDGFSALKPAGGYFIWVSGPPEWKSQPFVKYCSETYKLAVQTSAVCGSMEMGPITNGIRISFAFYEVEALRDAATTLCKAIQEHLQTN